jgi:hypothetical protein
MTPEIQNPEPPPPQKPSGPASWERALIAATGILLTAELLFIVAFLAAVLATIR